MKTDLFKRKLTMDVSCPVCGKDNETVEHLFFQCDFARRIWRVSRLGLDFSVGSPVAFGEWFLNWMCDALDSSALLESISILWTIWCCRNDFVFRNLQVDVMQAWREASYLHQLLCRALQRKEQLPLACGASASGDLGLSDGHKVILQDKLKRGGDLVPVKMVVDGAWRKETWDGAAAWVSCGRDPTEGACRVKVCSATMAEAWVVLRALEVARSKGWQSVELLTNCLLVVKGLQCIDTSTPCLLAGYIYKG